MRLSALARRPGKLWDGHSCSRRALTSAANTSFYRNRLLETYADKPTSRLSLRQLVFYGRAMNEDRLIKSANYVRTELPVRIAHRIRNMQSLPYVVVTNDEVAKVYELYWKAFDRFRTYPTITTLAENDAFCQFLHELLDEHLPVIPHLFLGLSLASPYMEPEVLDSFMRRMLVSRISRRVLAQHHIALSDSLAGRDGESPEDHVGIIYTQLNARESVEKCASILRQRPHDIDADAAQELKSATWPEVIVDGHLETRFSYIKEHFEYMVFELLKNSMRFTRLHHRDADIPPPIRVTVVAGTNDIHIRISDQGGGLLTTDIRQPTDLFSFSHTRNATRMASTRLQSLRDVVEYQGGVNATIEEQVQRWKRLAEIKSEEASKNWRQDIHPRIGLGLPMSNVFARYFGGELELVSLDGWGTDVYLRLPKLGTNLEGIEV
ncbi:alpha-ketoacid dehydrogenase kinase [Exidia glandulosa HHB12029]|uniref:Protein-serine/threonine kinase n=1 Tax=Exidia glandulosa HHB12029 TaxID=1314781 RepID=A0A165QU15_EXIGL|nr:alpha-ketoacid dehydrogenase kinase [Exidia glandulosa HHB12029]